ncbi:hypothetical protein GOODEAATRI_026037 [Goodea atripinnis]|uniref:Maturase K n=1 Tax=Goodea atripinnis TaxID=208336 RepID=A0ABV0NXZ9_9TELE
MFYLVGFIRVITKHMQKILDNLLCGKKNLKNWVIQKFLVQFLHFQGENDKFFNDHDEGHKLKHIGLSKKLIPQFFSVARVFISPDLCPSQCILELGTVVPEKFGSHLFYKISVHIKNNLCINNLSTLWRPQQSKLSK